MFILAFIFAFIEAPKAYRVCSSSQNLIMKGPDPKSAFIFRPRYYIALFSRVICSCLPKSIK